MFSSFDIVFWNINGLAHLRIEIECMSVDHYLISFAFDLAQRIDSEVVCI